MEVSLQKHPKVSGSSEVPHGFNCSRSSPSRVMVQAQLQLSHPTDSDELEADLLADSIINEGKIVRSVSKGFSGGVAMPSHMGANLAAFQGSGSRLYGGLKEQMEQGFGRDFSDVRLHTDSEAASMSESISARAFTYGNDIYFNRGQFNPQTKDGQHLLAHELAHVIQQTGKVSRKLEKNMSSNEDDRKSRLVFILRYLNLGIYKPGARALDMLLTQTDENGNAYTEEPSELLLRFAKWEKRGLSKRFLNTLLLSLTKNFPVSAQKNLSSDVNRNENFRKRLMNYYNNCRFLERQSEQIIAYALKDGRGAPVHVAMFMSLEIDHNGATAIIPDSFLNIDRLIVLRGMEDIKTCTKLLQFIDEEVGPIYNLIIFGHGEHNSIALNENHKFRISYVKNDKEDPYSFVRPSQDMLDTMEFFKVVGQLMPEEDNITKRIIFQACLTNSHVPAENSSQMNISDWAFRLTGWKNRDNLVSPKASVDAPDVQLTKFSDNEFTMSAKPTAQDSNKQTQNTDEQFTSQSYHSTHSSEPVGHIRDISLAFETTRDVRQLESDLDQFDEHFNWREVPLFTLLKYSLTILKINHEFSLIRSYIEEYKNRRREKSGGLEEIYFKILSVFHSLLSDMKKRNAMFEMTYRYDSSNTN